MKVKLDFEAPIDEMEKMVQKLKDLQGENDTEFNEQIRELEEKVHKRREEIYKNITPWQTVKIARHRERPVFQDYIAMIFSDFIELHGDRYFSDDHALIGGFARLGKQSVMIIGHNRGKNVEENIKRNFAQARPDGYRKALRLMKLAEKYNIPILTFIDTHGAYPGKDAEERGQAEAIARNLTEMAQIGVPIICVVTGEGGSGGAIGIGVGDIILMLSHSIYSVISPEGCAGILWRDGSYAEQAAQALKLTAPSLHKLGVIDEIIEEPIGGAHNDPEAVAAAVKKVLQKHMKRLKTYSLHKLLNRRFEKYSNIGVFNK
jgi:acetyl-CoA carboxylase carboxyl transferase subunit alpha